MKENLILDSTNNNKEITIEFPNNSLISIMLGNHSINLSRLEQLIEANIQTFGNQFKISGKDEHVKLAKAILTNVYDSISKERGKNIICEFSRFETELRMLKTDSNFHETIKTKSSFNSYKIDTWKKTIIPKSIGQKAYFDALNNYDLVFGLGPAGTGKSYLAVAKGIDMLKKGLVDKIILARPAVEAGERLGFLPGDMKEKIDPYLRPIYDALYEMMPSDRVEKKIESGEIEIAPLAFMRGRTFTNSFVIIDEAQNTTSVQMKMVLTRIGEGSRMVINGDLSQIDLPLGQKSGLKQAQEILNNIKSIKIIELGTSDIIRHPIVAEIIKAYDNS